MAEQKQAAFGTIIKLDHDANGSFDVQPLVINATPPGRDRELIEGKSLGDTFDVPILGIEQQSQFELEQFWHPGQTEHEKCDTLFESGAQAPWQIVTPHATPKTIEFPGKVVKLGPEQLQQGGTYKRKVTVQRTGAITLT